MVQSQYFSNDFLETALSDCVVNYNPSFPPYVRQANVEVLSKERDQLIQQVQDSNTTNQLLQSRLEASERVAMHSQTLHDQLGSRDVEIQGLSIRIQVSPGSTEMEFR